MSNQNNTTIWNFQRVSLDYAVTLIYKLPSRSFNHFSVACASKPSPSSDGVDSVL